MGFNVSPSLTACNYQYLRYMEKSSCETFLKLYSVFYSTFAPFTFAGWAPQKSISSPPILQFGRIIRLVYFPLS